MTTRSKYRGGVLRFFDDAQAYETVHQMNSLAWRDDFIGAGSVAIPAAGSPGNGVDWVKKLVGAGTPVVAGVANAGGGVMGCALDATSEKQEATLYWNDSRALDVTKGMVVEWRAKLAVLPSLSGVQAVLGLSAAWIDGPDNATSYLEFGANGSGLINCRSQDGTTQSNISSGTTVLATDWHVYRIDAVDLTDIRFYIDGTQVSATKAIAFAATGTAAVLQPYASVYKPSGAGVATWQLDYVKAWMNRQ